MAAIMDRSSSDTSAANGGRTRAPKSRNSDVRKEQNRVASRAYREKRKKKLALLDELLKSDAHTDSMSSVSDETDGYHTPLSIAHSRHASNSPAPATSSTHLPTAQWAATTHAIASTDPSYGHDTYSDCWMDSFHRSQDMFIPGTEYLQSFVPADVSSNSLGTSSQYVSSIQSIAPMPPASSVVLDPALSDSHLAAYHTFSAQNENMSNSSYIPAYDDGEIPGLGNDMINALESLSKLNYQQQQHVIDLVQKRRSLSYSTTSDQSLDFKYTDYSVTMPSTDGNKHPMATRRSKYSRT